MVLGFHHVQLAMPAGGEAAARRFYGDLLGLEEVAKPARLAARGGCWFGHRRFYTTDPFGNRLELIEATRARGR